MTCKYLQRIFDEYQVRKWKNFRETPRFVIKNFNLNVFMYEYIPKSAFNIVGFNFFYKNKIYKLEQILTKEQIDFKYVSDVAMKDIKLIEGLVYPLIKNIVYTFIQQGGDIVNTIMELQITDKKK